MEMTIRDERLIRTVAAALNVPACVCRTAGDLLDDIERSNMKQYDVYSRWGDCIGHVWAENATDALAVARAEYDGDVYVLRAAEVAK
jgi:hypothetical protein